MKENDNTSSEEADVLADIINKAKTLVDGMVVSFHDETGLTPQE